MVLAAVVSRGTDHPAFDGYNGCRHHDIESCAHGARCGAAQAVASQAQRFDRSRCEAIYTHNTRKYMDMHIYYCR